MSRFWIGLAMVLWFGAYAVAADAPSQVPQWFPSAVTTKADAATDSAPMPVRTKRNSSVELLRAPPATVAPARNREPDYVLVAHLRNAPAMQLAQTLCAVFEDDQRPGRFDTPPNVKIVAEVVSNCLVIAGPSELVHKVEALIDKLDRAPVMIRLEVVMGDVPAAIVPAAGGETRSDLHQVHASVADPDEARKNMEVLFQAEVTTLDNQPAHVRAGRREPTISAINSSPSGQVNAVTQQNLGTNLTFTPRERRSRRGHGVRRRRLPIRPGQRRSADLCAEKRRAHTQPDNGDIRGANHDQGRQRPDRAAERFLAKAERGQATGDPRHRPRLPGRRAGETRKVIGESRADSPFSS